jgi:hypothetical protein
MHRASLHTYYVTCPVNMEKIGWIRYVRGFHAYRRSFAAAWTRKGSDGKRCRLGGSSCRRRRDRLPLVTALGSRPRSICRLETNCRGARPPGAVRCLWWACVFNLSHVCTRETVEIASTEFSSNNMIQRSWSSSVLLH